MTGRWHRSSTRRAVGDQDLEAEVLLLLLLSPLLLLLLWWSFLCLNAVCHEVYMLSVCWGGTYMFLRFFWVFPFVLLFFVWMMGGGVIHIFAHTRLLGFLLFSPVWWVRPPRVPFSVFFVFLHHHHLCSPFVWCCIVVHTLSCHIISFRVGRLFVLFSGFLGGEGGGRGNRPLPAWCFS